MNIFPLTTDWEVLIVTHVKFRPSIYMQHKICGDFKTLYAILETGGILSMRYNLECGYCYKHFPDKDYLTPKILQFVDLFTILQLNI